MNWSDISLWQFQQLYALKQADSTHEKLIGILHDMTDRQVAELTQRDKIRLSLGLNFLNTEPDTRLVDIIKTEGREYSTKFNVRKMPAARYIEVKHFGGDVFGNMHQIAASMVTPKFEVYDAFNHADYAEDMQNARFVDVYGSVIKFLQGINNLDQNFATLWEGGGEGGKTNFPKVYGWHFHAERVAEMERIPLAEAYELPTINFLNDLSYLMAKDNYLRQD